MVDGCLHFQVSTVTDLCLAQLRKIMQRYLFNVGCCHILSVVGRWITDYRKINNIIIIFFLCHNNNILTIH